MGIDSAIHILLQLYRSIDALNCNRSLEGMCPDPDRRNKSKPAHPANGSNCSDFRGDRSGTLLRFLGSSLILLSLEIMAQGRAPGSSQRLSRALGSCAGERKAPVARSQTSSSRYKIA
jgi:hypothetical protein